MLALMVSLPFSRPSRAKAPGAVFYTIISPGSPHPNLAVRSPKLEALRRAVLVILREWYWVFEGSFLFRPDTIGLSGEAPIQ